MYRPEGFKWTWNEEDNLEGYEVRSGETDVHKFTWQPHGSQFTIIEEVPKNRLAIQIRKPPPLDRESVLRTLQFDETWVKVLDSLAAV